MTIRTKMIYTRALSMMVLSLFFIKSYAQEFTLENQYNKMIKKYPFIVPYLPSDSGLVVKKDVVYRTIDSSTVKADREKVYQAFCNQSTSRKLCFDLFSLPLNRKGPERRSLVVFVHGGGWSTGSKEMDHPMAIALARKGFVCACIDYRKSNEALYPAAVEDVYTAVSTISRQYSEELHLDGRICLIGSSAGGQLASLVGCNDDNYIASVSASGNSTIQEYDSVQCRVKEDGGSNYCRINKVIDIDGVLAFIHRDSAEGVDKPGKLSSATRWLGKQMSEDSLLWNEASALYHVNAQSADFAFVVGTQKRFTAGIGEMVDSLAAYGHSANIYRIFSDEAIAGLTPDEIETLPENTTPHCFWLFSPWAEKVISAIVSEIDM